MNRPAAEVRQELLLRLRDDGEEHSIKEVARILGVSEQTARRHMLLNNMYSSDTATEVQSLYASGMTVQEIATQLHMTPVTVFSYLPYTKGAYSLTPQSIAAQRTAECRRRKAKNKPPRS